MMEFQDRGWKEGRRKGGRDGRREGGREEEREGKSFKGLHLLTSGCKSWFQ